MVRLQHSLTDDKQNINDKSRNPEYGGVDENGDEIALFKLDCAGFIHDGYVFDDSCS